MLILLLDAFWLLCFAAALGTWRSSVSRGSMLHRAGYPAAADSTDEHRETEHHWLSLGLSIATATVGFGLVAWVTPTLLSLWNGLTTTSVAVVWLAACATVALVWRRSIAAGWTYATEACRQLAAWLRGSPNTTSRGSLADNTVRTGRTLTLAWGCTVTVLLLLTLASATLYPPTVWDSHSHHLPRIVQFIQNQTVAPFPTYYPSMNATYPFTAYLNTQATLLWGSTDILNLTQWFAYVCSAVLVYTATKMLGGSTGAARIATIIGMTAPSVALQASSTQYDLVTALWCLTAIVFVLSLRSQAPLDRSQLHLAALLGAALGLGAVTKITFIALVAPFCLWLAVSYVRTAGVGRTAAAGGIAVLVAVVITVPWLGQNLALNAGALGTESPGNSFMLVQDRSPRALWTNAVRNLTMQLSTPIAGVNRSIERAAAAIAAPLGIPIDAPTNKEDYGHHFELPTWTFHPDMASSPITALMLMIAVPTVALVQLRRSAPQDAAPLVYTLCAAVGTVTIAAFVTWNSYITRSLGTAILVIAPLGGMGVAALARSRARRHWSTARQAVVYGLLTGAVSFCLLAIVFNASAPLVSRSTIFGGNWNGYWNLPYHERGWGVDLPFMRPDVVAVREIAVSQQLQRSRSRGGGADSSPCIALIGGEAGDHMPVYPLIVELQKAGYVVVYEDRYGPIPLRGAVAQSAGYETAVPELVLSYDLEGSGGTATFRGAPIGSSVVYELSSQRVTAYELTYQRLTPEFGTALSIYRAVPAGGETGR